MTEKDTRQRLIEAATSLFAFKGYSAVSIRELSKAANVNSALITYHFGSKEGLYEAVLENQFEQVRLMAQKVISENEDPVARIQQLILGLISLHQRFPYIRRFMSSELSNPSPYMDRIIKKFIKELYFLSQKVIGEAITQGEVIDRINPTYTLVAIAGTIHFYFLAQPVIDELIPPHPGRDQEYANQLLDICFNGIGVQRDSDGS